MIQITLELALEEVAPVANFLTTLRGMPETTAKKKKLTPSKTAEVIADALPDTTEVKEDVEETPPQPVAEPAPAPEPAPEAPVITFLELKKLTPAFQERVGQEGVKAFLDRHGATRFADLESKKELYPAIKAELLGEA